MTKPADAIRVLIVDDSAVIRGALGRIIDAEPDMQVVTTAPNGKVALDALRHTKIDVVLLDIEMPVMDGLTALPLILSQYPAARVIIASSLTQRGAEVTMQAMSLGATDFIAKPAARTGSATLQAIASEIASKVRGIGQVARRAQTAVSGGVRPAAQLTGPLPTPSRTAALGTAALGTAALGAAALGTASLGTAPVAGAPLSPAPPRTALLASRGSVAAVRIVAIAASTGGPNALAAVLSALPRDFAPPILVTQHMPAVFTAMLAQRLERDALRPCREARDGEPILSNHTYVAPGGFHMVVQTHEGVPFVRLTETEPENYCRPAADPMFRSVAAIYGASTLAVVLTGMGEDGLRGCRDVHAQGGRIVVQDEASSVVWGMPGAVANAGIASSVIPLSGIADSIHHSCRALAA